MSKYKNTGHWDQDDLKWKYSLIADNYGTKKVLSGKRTNTEMQHLSFSDLLNYFLPGTLAYIIVTYSIEINCKSQM